MKINKFGARTAAMAASAVFAASVAVAQQGISVIVNGNPVVFNGARPQEVNGRVLVPLRGVLEQLGAYVDWQPAGQLVTATKANTDIQLRIGERMARVNNRPVTLDVPAMIYRGNTMVPLRFVSEALGADVRWEPSQYAVLINTGITESMPSRGEEYNNLPATNNPVDISIESFTMDHTGWLNPGSTVRFTLRGTPGGVATLNIPGLAREIPMDEVSRGTYETTWTVPENRDRVNLSRINAVARLRFGQQERVIQADRSVSVDTSLPTITMLEPEANSRVTVARPTISAGFDDQAGSGVDPRSVRLTVDGRDVTPEADITQTSVTYTPATSLDPGRHEVRLSATDMAGNEITKLWSFRVDAQASQRVIRTFNVRGLENAQPGDVIRFTLTAAPGGRASFSIGDIARNRPMEEREPGRYFGTYTVRRGDVLSDEPITARFVANSGEVYTVRSTDRFDVDGGELDSPIILSPRADDPVRDPLIVEGTAPQNSRVLIHVDYSTSVSGGVRLTGAVSDFVVVAGEDGHFRTNPIDLDTTVRGRNTRYTITATTLGSNDRRSTATTVTISR